MLDEYNELLADWDFNVTTRKMSTTELELLEALDTLRRVKSHLSAGNTLSEHENAILEQVRRTSYELMNRQVLHG